MEQPSFNEGDALENWNNWLPSSYYLQRKTCSSSEKQVPKTFNRNVFDSSKKTSLTSFPENFKYGNWVPPINFLNCGFRVEKILHKSNQKSSQRKTGIESNIANRKKSEVLGLLNKCSSNTPWKKEINLDWGKRTELSDAVKFIDGDTIWGIVNLGIFSNIKIWINEYGNICGSAEGKITKLYSSEITLICITNTQLIRKMLGLSGAQWASICERLQETNSTLKFDAFQNSELTNKTDLEKLWFFICKRRHFLSDQCMLVKLCGGVKCMRKFQIIPKLLVQDIRSILGEPIL